MVLYRRRPQTDEKTVSDGMGPAGQLLAERQENIPIRSVRERIVVGHGATDCEYSAEGVGSKSNG
jgi:hypothetical protein